MISEKTISLWQSEFVILSNHLGCLQNFSRWQRFVDKCFVSQVISFSATVAILINWTYDRVCRDWNYCHSIQRVLLSELTAAFIVLEMGGGEHPAWLYVGKWWKQRKGWGKKAWDKGKEHEGTKVSCHVHYLAGSKKTLGWHKCMLLPRCPVWPIMTLKVTPEVLSKLDEGRWQSKPLRFLVANTGRLAGLNRPDAHFMRPSQSVPDMSPRFPGPAQATSHYLSKLKQLLPGLVWPTRRRSPRAASRKKRTASPLPKASAWHSRLFNLTPINHLTFLHSPL